MAVTRLARSHRYAGLASSLPGDRIEGVVLDNVILAGYPYEFVGLLYFVFYLLMGRKRYAGVYTLRSRVLTLLAAMVMVGCVPFRYSATQLGIVAMFAVAIIAMIPTVRDSATARKRLEAARKPTPATPRK